MLPQFPPPLNNSDPVNVNVTNEQPVVPFLRSAISNSWFASAVISKAAGTPGIHLVSLLGYNKGGAQWLHIFDAAALPANGASPFMIVALSANFQFFVDLPNEGFMFSEGIVIAVSTTETTLTLGAADVKLAYGTKYSPITQ
jgi:hypothetical protein